MSVSSYLAGAGVGGAVGVGCLIPVLAFFGVMRWSAPQKRCYLVSYFNADAYGSMEVALQRAGDTHGPTHSEIVDIIQRTLKSKAAPIAVSRLTCSPDSP